jgi:hypothetical protein
VRESRAFPLLAQDRRDRILRTCASTGVTITESRVTWLLSHRATHRLRRRCVASRSRRSRVSRGATST